MIKALKFLTYILSILALSSCIDRYDFRSNITENNLVIEAILENNNNLKSIFIKNNIDLSTTNFRERGINNADVKVYGSDGSIFDFQNTADGSYVNFTEGPILVEGVSYTLKVELADGRKYESTPELYSVGKPIDSIYYKTTSTVGLTEFNEITELKRLDFYINTYNDQEDDSYYLWNTRGVYEIFTFPELRRNGAGEISPAPCSSVFMPSCICCRCWIRENFSKIYTGFTDTRKSQIIGQYVGSVVITPTRFAYKYNLIVDQTILTESAFKFWSTYEKIQSNTGSIFDNPPINIPSNIRNIDNPDEKVYGIFTTYRRSTKDIFIEYFNLEERPRAPLPIYDACDLPTYSTTDRPSNW